MGPEFVGIIDEGRSTNILFILGLGAPARWGVYQ
jgi:hypothetical protein